ncbi:MAG: hypothetical protein WAO98_05685 [Alphaproteobacteria bacterium]
MSIQEKVYIDPRVMQLRETRIRIATEHITPLLRGTLSAVCIDYPVAQMAYAYSDSVAASVYLKITATRTKPDAPFFLLGFPPTASAVPEEKLIVMKYEKGRCSLIGQAYLENKRGLRRLMRTVRVGVLRTKKDFSEIKRLMPITHHGPTPP